MLDNLALLGAVIIILWMAALAYYFRVSRQQKELQKEIDVLQELLDDEPEGQDG